MENWGDQGPSCRQVLGILEGRRGRQLQAVEWAMARRAQTRAGRQEPSSDEGVSQETPRRVRAERSAWKPPSSHGKPPKCGGHCPAFLLSSPRLWGRHTNHRLAITLLAWE